MSIKHNIKNIAMAPRSAVAGESIHGVKCYGIVSAENPNSQSQGAALDGKGTKSLSDALESAHYPFVHQSDRLAGNNEYSYLVFNIPLEVMMHYSGKFHLTSFLYGTIQEDGTVLHERWEKTDMEMPYDKVTNPYFKKDEATSHVEIDANDNYSIVGRNFKYVIPVSIFESVYRGIKENCIRNKHPYTENFCHWLTESVGRTGWMTRGWAYKGLYLND